MCAQCGGELQFDEGQVFVTCPFCDSTVYLEKSRVVFPVPFSPLDVPARGDFVVVAIEVERRDKVSQIKFSVELTESCLWVLPA